MWVEILVFLILLAIGGYFGWLLAKGRVKRYKKAMEKKLMMNISEQEMKKQAEDDELFWKMKGGINNERKRKYGTGFKETDRKSNKGTRGGESAVEIEPSDELREPEMDDSDQSNEPNEQAAESDLFVPSRLE